MRILFLFLISISCFAGDANIDIALYTLRTQGHEAASQWVSQNTDLTIYQVGEKLRHYTRINEALEWYTSFYQGTSELKYLVGASWATFISGNASKAKDLALEVLSKNPQPLIKARAYRIMADVSYGGQKFGEAKEYAEISFGIYKELSHDKGMGHCYLIYALISRADREFGNAEKQLQNAKHHYKLSGNEQRILGKLYDVRAEIHWAKKEFITALEFVEKSKLAYFEDGQTLNALIVKARQALMLIRAGKINEATSIVKEVDAFAIGKSISFVRIFNSVAVINLARCNGDPFSERLKELESWPDYKGSLIESAYEYFSEEIPCTKNK